MPAIAPQPVQITCPNCRTPFRTGIFSIVDAGEQPELKQALLAGQINVAVCPNCGTPTMLGAPLLYHDASKQLCMVFFPQELNVPPQDQERFIGEATNFIINGLPAGAARGYLLNPKRFISMNTLIDSIYEADGVPKEVLDAQRRRVNLIADFAQAMENNEDLAKLVEQHRADIDMQFFDVLTAFADANAQQGRDDGAQMLLDLRDKVAELAGVDLEAGPEDDYEAALDDAVEQLVAVDDAELEPLVGELRPVIDYSFFQLWTARIETLERAGDSAEAQRLTERRARILEIVERMDTQAQAMLDASGAVLEAVIDAPDIKAALQEQGDKVDESFVMVVSAHMEALERNGDQATADRLQQIATAAMEVIEERMTPEDRFIRQLLSFETPQESTKLLRRSFAQVTPALVKRLNEQADLADQNGIKETADQLRKLGREAGAMLL